MERVALFALPLQGLPGQLAVLIRLTGHAKLLDIIDSNLSVDGIVFGDADPYLVLRNLAEVNETSVRILWPWTVGPRPAGHGIGVFSCDLHVVGCSAVLWGLLKCQREGNGGPLARSRLNPDLATKHILDHSLANAQA